MEYFGFHAFQSFAKGEVTPELAHKIGVELANELWGDRFEVVVTTHLNTNCIHNHFCLNSVSFKDGKKYYDNHTNYALMRQISDRICAENNLSVIKEKKCSKSNIEYEKFYKNNVKKIHYYASIKEDIDYAIEQAYSFIDFIGIMKKMNYEIEERYGRLNVRPEYRKRNIRIERIYGEEYSIKNINKRIFETENVRVPFPEVRTLKRKFKFSTLNKKDIKSKIRITGIRALYFHYCYLLKVFPKKKRVISKELREEINKMDKISNEARFLVTKGIKTKQELLTYKSSVITKVNTLKSKREYLWKKKQKKTTDVEKQEIQNEINEIATEIKKIISEQELIEDIEKRIPKIKENLKEIENEDKNRKIEGRDRY